MPKSSIFRSDAHLNDETSVVDIATKTDLAIWLCNELFTEWPKKSGSASTPKMVASLLGRIITRGYVLADEVREAMLASPTDKQELMLYHEGVHAVALHLVTRTVLQELPATIDDFLHSAATALYHVENGSLTFPDFGGVGSITSHGLKNVNVRIFTSMSELGRDPKFDQSVITQLLDAIQPLPIRARAQDRKPKRN